jgi:hypothetical protein
MDKKYCEYIVKYGFGLFDVITYEKIGNYYHVSNGKITKKLSEKMFNKNFKTCSDEYNSILNITIDEEVDDDEYISPYDFFEVV